MATDLFASFLKEHLNTIEPLSRAVNIAHWNASISGKATDFERSAELQVELQRVYSNPSEFERIRNWRENGPVTEPNDLRQLDLLYMAYLRNQIDPALNERTTKLASKIENQFNVFRAAINGRSVTSNDILTILKESRDPAYKRQAWEAGKEVGTVVRDDLLTLVRLRNEGARAIGYRDYYAMSMDLAEQDEDEIVALFGELEALTREPFAALKREMDERIATRHGIGVDDIRPWHYEDPFFQEAPQVYDVNLDTYYQSTNILELVSRYYLGIGLEVDDIIARSDLYEKPGKDQHAYCMDIDRRGDIRTLANIKADETWAGTILHELGHAVHDKYIDSDLPFLLRQEAHIFTTEAVAMLFGRLSKDANWIQQMIGMPDDEKRRIECNLARSHRLHQLIFSRWCQVMLHFERELYADPEQDLNELWWCLCRDYQGLTPPDCVDVPHWASKTHIVSVPVYYHNYQLGEILASQLKHHIQSTVIPAGSADTSFCGVKAVGNYLKESVFAPGTRYRWNVMIEKATGEPLSPRHFVREFVERPVPPT